MKNIVITTIIIMTTFLLLNSCKKNDLAAFNPEIINIKDNFQLQATSVTKVSDNLEYSWENSGTVANIDHSSVINGGTATVKILDASGTEVYNKDLSIDGSFTSNSGTNGVWTIKVELKKVEGDLNFRVQKGG